ncbi:FAD-dependent oxidoreductase [Sphingomonas profundi]|uniref:FAD-dependent oxidoreductase n=1 Tax=Alterirhizorhabdus profundi TaxID=2681549 RepID=UPI0012E9147E|nr:FAD-dependent monooxygenase [Sphingomonas profundi]
MYDVTIVGGGPTGFINALGLAQAGVKVRLVEAGPHIINSPRAMVYHWSVLEGLDRLGILAEAEGIGFRKQDYTYLVHRTGERIPYSLEVLEGHTPYPYNLHLGQHRLAEIAMARLGQLPNAEISFNARLTALRQDADGVTLSIDTPSGPEEVRSAWVIGADGAGSAVRQLLGLDFEGMTWPERFVATNVHYDFERHGYARSTLLIDDTYGAVIAKIDNEGLWRCTYMEDGALPADTFMDRLPDFYREILPGADDYRVDMATPYRMHQRSASRYRVGRVVLAGDAAHATNPTGGLGLTSGLFDSYVLYPALAAIVLEQADDAVLDRYSDERRAMFVDRASPQASANKQVIFHASGGGAMLEQTLAMLRRLSTDDDFRLDRLMFTRTLESAPLLDRSLAVLPS